jgi:hypothetical protein
MADIVLNSKSYLDLAALQEQIRTAQVKAALAVNKEMLYTTSHETKSRAASA